jgi:putative ABC transport system permease protein
MNSWLEKARIVLFLITPRLLVIAILFALLIGALSGLYPAYRASKMRPNGGFEACANRTA